MHLKNNVSTVNPTSEFQSGGHCNCHQIMPLSQSPGDFYNFSHTLPNNQYALMSSSTFNPMANSVCNSGFCSQAGCNSCTNGQIFHAMQQSFARGAGNYNKGRNRGYFGRNGGCASKPTCQLCGTYEHVAANCYYRFDTNYNGHYANSYMRGAGTNFRPQQQQIATQYFTNALTPPAISHPDSTTTFSSFPPQTSHYPTTNPAHSYGASSSQNYKPQMSTQAQGHLTFSSGDFNT